MTEYIKIGNKMKQIRTQKRLTQEQVAQKIGAEQYAVSNLEHAKKGSGIDNLDKLAQIGECLEVDIHLDIDGEKFPLNKSAKSNDEKKESISSLLYDLEHLYKSTESYWQNQELDADDFYISDFSPENFHVNRLELKTNFDYELEPVSLDRIYFVDEIEETDNTYYDETDDIEYPVLKESYYPKSMYLMVRQYEAIPDVPKEYEVLLIKVQIVGDHDKLFYFPLNKIIDTFYPIAEQICSILDNCSENNRYVTNFHDILLCINNTGNAKMTLIPTKIKYNYLDKK